MLTKTKTIRADLEHAPLIIRRVDAIPVALPLKAPMSMSGVTIATAENVLVRIEAKGGAVGWGEAASAPTMTGDTLGGLVAAVRDYLAPLLVGEDARDVDRLWSKLRWGCSGAGSAAAASKAAILGPAAAASFDQPAVSRILA